MTGDERAHAQIKSSILDVLNNESDRAVKFSLTKRGYMHILRMNQLNCCCFSLEHQIESDMHADVNNGKHASTAYKSCWQYKTVLLK